MQIDYPEDATNGPIPTPTGAFSATPALSNVVLCDTTNLQVTADLKI